MISELAAFAGGVLFGTAGVKALGSKDAKKAYAHTAAFGLRVKDSVMNRALLKTQLLQTHKLSKGCQIGSLLSI